MRPDTPPQKTSKETPPGPAGEDFDFEYADALDELEDNTMASNDMKTMTIMQDNKMENPHRGKLQFLAKSSKTPLKDFESKNGEVVNSYHHAQSPSTVTPPKKELIPSSLSPNEKKTRNLPLVSDKGATREAIYLTENNNSLHSGHPLFQTETESNSKDLGLEKNRKDIKTNADITMTEKDKISKKSAVSEKNTTSSHEFSSGDKSESRSPAIAQSQKKFTSQNVIPQSTQTSTSTRPSAALTSPSTLSTTSKPSPSLLSASNIVSDITNMSTKDMTSSTPAEGENVEFDTKPRRTSFTLSVGSSCSVSGVDIKLHSSKTDDDFSKKLDGHAQCPSSASCDVIIGSNNITSKSQESDGKLLTASSRQNGGSKERNSLSMKISRSLGNFFQKSSSNNPTRLESSRRLESKDSDQTTGKTSAQGLQNKEAKRRGSLAGRLMTSFAEWGRRRPSTNKAKSPSGNETQKDENDLNELFNNNKKRVPVFVSPGDQVAIVLGEAPSTLTEEQKVILRESWSVIKTDVADVGVETFMGLFNTHPDAIDSFLAFKDKSVTDIEQSAVLKAHALRVMQTVDKCVSRLDVPDKMATVLFQLGKRHVGYQANAKLIPMIGKQFVAAIEPKMAEKWSLDVKASWEVLFTIINYNIRKGIKEETSKRKEEVQSGDKKT